MGTKKQQEPALAQHQPWGEHGGAEHCRGHGRSRRERGHELREVLLGGVGPVREVTSKSAVLYEPERVMNYPVQCTQIAGKQLRLSLTQVFSF